MLNGLMQAQQLQISSILEHAEICYPDRVIVSYSSQDGEHRYTYKEAAERVRKLANSLITKGLKLGDRVATLAWNTHRHFELFYGVSGIGAVLHTVNPRLFLEQIIFILNKGGADTLFFDNSFAELVEKIASECPKIKKYICLQQATDVRLPDTVSLEFYEDYISEGSADLDWPEFDENAASSLCFTSGTTGEPKGVLYSHRSTLLHALVASHSNAFGINADDTVLPIAPLYHANAWAMPYICPLVGASMVFPGDQLDARGLVSLMNRENVTFAAAVPTIWKGVLDFLEEEKGTLKSLKRTIIGGTAVPRSMIERFAQDYGVKVLQVWGMTETSPLGVCCTETPAVKGLPKHDRENILHEKQGRRQFGIDLRIVDEAGNPLEHDGVVFGRLQVKGAWVASAYYGMSDGEALTEDGWFETGDMATIDKYGYMKITDRTKDVIKSGGEWISSVEIENVALGHPDVALAVVVGVAHEKWDERPVLLIVPKQGRQVSQEKMQEFIGPQIARWWLPDAVITVDSLPMTATGKIDKKKLRVEYQNILLEQVVHS